MGDPVAAFVAFVNDLSSIVSGYVLTAVALGGYVAALMVRARRARLRAEAVAARRDRAPASRPPGERS
ncbi:MAG TPA: hypothetical protein VGB19_03060 [Actinomycetota bacterium]